MVARSKQRGTKRQVHRAFGIASALAVGVFLFHTGIIFEIARLLHTVHPRMTDNYGAAFADRILILVSFFALFTTHVIEAAVWGLFFWRQGLTPTFTEGIYFSATSITTLGYGDVVLPAPWRVLGPLVAISGTLMFGCSTAFLFLVLQKMWLGF